MDASAAFVDSESPALRFLDFSFCCFSGMLILLGCKNCDIFGIPCAGSGESSSSSNAFFWCIGVSMVPFGDTRIKVDGGSDCFDVLGILEAFLLVRTTDCGTVVGPETASRNAFVSAATGDD